jgi:hypothetical protein
MTCPIMAGLAAVRTHADGPAALLGRADDLGLTADRQKKLKEIEGSARQQARQALTDKQREQVGIRGVFSPTSARLPISRGSTTPA